MSAQRDPLMELARLVRLAEPAAENIGHHLSEHEDVIVSVLGPRPEEMSVAKQAHDDISAAVISPLLDRWYRQRLLSSQRRARDRSLQTASILAERTRWMDGRAVLEPGLLLGELLADRRIRFVSFVLPEGSNVTVLRSMLASLARLAPRLTDLSAWIDAHALRFRWRQQRGGLNLLARAASVRDEQVLRIVIPDASEVSPDPQHLPNGQRSEPFERAHSRVDYSRERAGAWLGEVLGELGWP
jgi:hypothetical protein